MGRIERMSSFTILYDRLRWEEKAIYEEAKKQGIKASLVDAKSTPISVVGNDFNPKGIFEEVVLQRTLSHFRGLYYASVLESYGYKVINSFKTSLICGNKLLTTIELHKRGIPTPRTIIAFSMDSALKAMDEIGYPIVMKPITGSWGRMVVKIRDRKEAKAILETKELIPDPLQQIYYIQEYISRPPRDIRVVIVGGTIVASVYRYQPEDDWRTNVARGGIIKPFKLSSEHEELFLRAAEAVGGGILGIDAMEVNEGILIHEINSNVEFRGASQASDKNIPLEIINYLKEVLRK
ncbi:lysine biosynthesis protein LysX [Candidatus Geothermarchaeota archaeon]|nr:MAG: lysine biosynthesis protein LysX [Candidatus Geothermarchaeota archaeon]